MTEPDTLVVPYVAPAITDDSRDYWTGGAKGELRIFRCGDCSNYIHPPVPVCRRCRSMNVGPVAVSGRGAIYSFTINHQPWSADFQGPYAIALVEIEEQAGVHLTTNIVGTPLDAIRIGAPVHVDFHRLDEAWLPIFRVDAAETRR